MILNSNVEGEDIPSIYTFSEALLGMKAILPM